MSFDKTINYRDFEIGLDRGSDGSWCAALADKTRDLYDYGQVAAFVPYRTAVADAKSVADDIRDNPEDYE